MAAMKILNDAMRQQIQAYLTRYPTKQAVVLPALHVVQEHLRCVPNEAMVEIAQILELAPAEVHDTMSFYGFFRAPDKPLGRHRCWVCWSISCAVCGGEVLLDTMCRKLGVSPGGTTPDGRITVEFAECLGGCDFAPCMLVDGVLHKNLTEEKIDELVKSLQLPIRPLTPIPSPLAARGEGRRGEGWRAESAYGGVCRNQPGRGSGRLLVLR